MTSGRKKLFQMPTKVKSPMVTRAGFITGAATRVNSRNSLAPSIRAASMIASGTAAAAYTRDRYTPNGLTRLGSSTDQ